jgi:hypothetical protein
MPYGKGTYGKQVGRPPVTNTIKKSSPLKDVLVKREAEKQPNLTRKSM